MTYIVEKVEHIVYRVKNEITRTLPTRLSDVYLEFADDVEEPTDWMIQNAVGLYIMNMTGYTPETFVVDDLIPYGVILD